MEVPQPPECHGSGFRFIHTRDFDGPGDLFALHAAFTKKPNDTDLERRISTIIERLTNQFQTSTAPLPYLLRRLQIVPVPLELKYNTHSLTEMCILNVKDVMGELEQVYSALFATVEDVLENRDDELANPLLLRRPPIEEVQTGKSPPFYEALRSLLIAVCDGDTQVSYRRLLSEINGKIDLCMQYLKIIAEANDQLSLWIQEFAVEENGTAYKSRFSPITRKNGPEVYFNGPPNLNHTILDLYVRLVVASGGWYKTAQYTVQDDEMLMLTMNKDLMCVTAFIRVLTRVVQNSSTKEQMELRNQNSTLCAKSQASSSAGNAKRTPPESPLLCVLMPSEVERAWEEIKDERKQGTPDTLRTFKDAIEYLLTKLRVGVYPMGEISLNGNIYGGYFPTGVSDTEGSDQGGERETNRTQWNFFSTIKPDMLCNLRNLESTLNLFLELITHPCSMCTPGDSENPLGIPTVCLLRCNNAFKQDDTVNFPHNSSNALVLCGRKDVRALQFCMGGLCPYGFTGFCKGCLELQKGGEIATEVDKLQSALQNVFVGGMVDVPKATVFEKEHFEPICSKGSSCEECTGFKSRLANWKFETRQSNAFVRHARPAVLLDAQTKPPPTKRVGEPNHEEVTDQLKAHFLEVEVKGIKALYTLFVRSKHYPDNSEGDLPPVDDQTKERAVELKRKQQEQQNRVNGMRFLTSVAKGSEKDSEDDWNKLSPSGKCAKLKEDAHFWHGISSDLRNAIGQRLRGNGE